MPPPKLGEKEGETQGSKVKARALGEAFFRLQKCFFFKDGWGHQIAPNGGESNDLLQMTEAKKMRC